MARLRLRLLGGFEAHLGPGPELEWRTELARLLPELGAGQEPASGPAETLTLFESVAHLLAHLADGHLLVLILEDLHWADEMSLRLLAFLVHRLRDKPMLIAVTGREEDAARPIAERALRICEHEGVIFWRVLANSIWGSLLALRGDAQAGLIHLAQSANLQSGLGFKALLSTCWTRWAEGLLLDARIEDAQQTAMRAIELAQIGGERGVEAEALYVLASAYAGAEGGDLALPTYERAATLADDLGMRPLVARCHLGLGRLHQHTDRVGHLVAASRMFSEMNMPFWLKITEADLAGENSRMPQP